MIGKCVGGCGWTCVQRGRPDCRLERGRIDFLEISRRHYYSTTSSAADCDLGDDELVVRHPTGVVNDDVTYSYRAVGYDDVE